MSQVSFIMRKRLGKPVPYENAYEFTPNGKYPWIQKALFYVLSKLNCHVATYVKHTVDTDNIISKLLEEKYALFDIYNEEGAFLLIGAEEYKALTKNPDITHAIGFTGSYWYDNTICGLRIIVLPWMQGMLVIPKLESIQNIT